MWHTQKTGLTLLYFFLILALVAAASFIMYKSAWVGDDAYVTFRTVDNFVNGHGLTWNTRERVQGYTHPLWMFLISGVYFFTREIYFTSLITSLVVSTLAVAVFSLKVSKSWVASATGIVLLVCSKAFIDYTTSGLENPLTYLMIAIFFLIYFKESHSRGDLFLLAFTAALGAVNRMDTLLLFCPALLFAYIKSGRWVSSFLIMLLGAMPLFLWLGFSTFYYGFPFPNTAYAKLNTGVDAAALARQGIHYLYHTFTTDPITLLVTGLGFLSFLYNRKLKILPLSVGILFYILYIIKIGGDFMGGRFLAAPLFCAVISLSRVKYNSAKALWLPLITFSLFISLTSSSNPILSGKDYKNRTLSKGGVADERGVYFPYAGLLNADRKNFIPKLLWVDFGWENKANAPCVRTFGYVGLYGYYSGPDVHIVDFHALTDPLLARLHIKDFKKWRIGHFGRNVPDGYVETLETGKNVIKNPQVAEYWDKLSTIITGDLFDKERLKLIWNFNRGKYDYLLSRFNNTKIKMPVSVISEPKKEGTKWDAPGNIIFYNQGLEIDLKKRYKAGKLEVSLDGNDIYNIEFLSNKKITGKQTTKLKKAGNGLILYTLDIPEKAVKKGFNKIRIFPVKGDGRYSIGHAKIVS